MSTKTYIKTLLLVALAALSLGGLLLHLRIHSPADHAYNYVPAIAGVLGVLLIPALFSFRKTLDYGYILNGMFVIIGTITMTHYSLVHWTRPATLETLLFKTTLADILILWGKFFVGKAVFDLEMHGYDPNLQQQGKWWRYPCLGWWLIHLVVISAVYGAGNYFWK